MVSDCGLKLGMFLHHGAHLLLKGLDPIRDIINFHLVGASWETGKDRFLDLGFELLQSL